MHNREATDSSQSVSAHTKSLTQFAPVQKRNLSVCNNVTLWYFAHSCVLSIERKSKRQFWISHGSHTSSQRQWWANSTSSSIVVLPKLSLWWPSTTIKSQLKKQCSHLNLSQLFHNWHARSSLSKRHRCSQMYPALSKRSWKAYNCKLPRPWSTQTHLLRWPLVVKHTI